MQRHRKLPTERRGLVVEAGKAVETAVGITVASDDDTSVKGAQWKY